MASTDPESINMEMDTGPASGASQQLWQRVRSQLNPGRHSVAENALAVVVIILFVVVIALAASHGGGGGGGGGTLPQGSACEAEACLYRSAYLVSLMNRSVSPCDDFYRYACGNAAQVIPISPVVRERTIVKELLRQNEDRLEAILRSPTVRSGPDSYERKLKTFFGKCVNDFLIERVKGSVLAMLLRPNFYVMNASTVDRFNFDEMLMSVHKTFGAPALFKYSVGPNQRDSNKYTISISNGGIGMLPAMYLFEFYSKQREAYSAYIGTVAQLLVNDAEPGSVDAGATARVQDFVFDVMEIETELANITRTAAIPDPNKPPLDPANQVSLVDMNDLYQPVKWTNLFMQTLTPNAQEGTKIAIMEPDYLKRVMQYVREKLVALHPVDYKRKLSNYLNWQIIRSYTGDLSSAYVHAKREFESSLSSSSFIYQSKFDYCFDRVQEFMLRGLSALFVADHLVDASKGAIDNIYKAVQGELLSAIDRLDWFREVDKTKSKAKVQAIVDKIGYSSKEIENAYLDSYYQDFRIESDDYLMDMSVSWQNFNRLRLGSLLGTQLDRSEWTGATYAAALAMSSAAELTIPAGILQWPFFTQQLPGYINYATIGQRVASELIKSIDATGQITNAQGDVDPIWSAETLLQYVDKAKCVNASFSGLRAGPYTVGNQSYYVNIDPIIVRTLRDAIADVDGLRMAGRVYAGSQASSSELPLPLGHLNKAQTFFVSWAQSYCYTRDPLYSYIRGLLGRLMPEEIHVNTLLSILPEFGQAFQCTAGSKMMKPGGGCDPIFHK